MGVDEEKLKLSSREICFFCLEPFKLDPVIKRELHQENAVDKKPLLPLQSLLSFLEISPKGKGAEILCSESKGRVPICGRCSSVTGKFSQLYNSLQELRMKLLHTVCELCDVIKNSAKDLVGFEKAVKKIVGADPSGLDPDGLVSGILELRAEILEKGRISASENYGRCPSELAVSSPPSIPMVSPHFAPNPAKTPSPGASPEKEESNSNFPSPPKRMTRSNTRQHSNLHQDLLCHPLRVLASELAVSSPPSIPMTSPHFVPSPAETSFSRPSPEKEDSNSCLPSPPRRMTRSNTRQHSHLHQDLLCHPLQSKASELVMPSPPSIPMTSPHFVPSPAPIKEEPNSNFPSPPKRRKQPDPPPHPLQDISKNTYSSSLTCPYCQVPHSMPSILLRHLVRSHRHHFFQTSKLPSISQANFEETVSKLLFRDYHGAESCPFCRKSWNHQKSYFRRQALYNHLVTHHEDEMREKLAALQNDPTLHKKLQQVRKPRKKRVTVSKPTKTNRDKPMVCPCCDEGIVRVGQQGLNEHLMRFHAYYFFRSLRTSLTQQELTTVVHKILLPPFMENNECQICQHRFKKRPSDTTSALRVHLVRVHFKEVKAKLRVLLRGKMIKSKATALAEPEKPLKCDKCERRFATMDSVKSHQNQFCHGVVKAEVKPLANLDEGGASSRNRYARRSSRKKIWQGRKTTRLRTSSRYRVSVIENRDETKKGEPKDMDETTGAGVTSAASDDNRRRTTPKTKTHPHLKMRTRFNCRSKSRRSL